MNFSDRSEDEDYKSYVSMFEVDKDKGSAKNSVQRNNFPNQSLNS